MHISVFVYKYYAKLEEITHSQKPKNCNKFKNPPGWKFSLASEDVREKGAFASPVTRQVLAMSSCHFFQVT